MEGTTIYQFVRGGAVVCSRDTQAKAVAYAAMVRAYDRHSETTGGPTTEASSYKIERAVWTVEPGKSAYFGRWVSTVIVEDVPACAVDERGMPVWAAVQEANGW